MNRKGKYRRQALTVCTLGGNGAGKTSLTAAIRKIVSRIGSTPADRQDIEAQEPTRQTISASVDISYRSIDYETGGRHYTQIDGLSHADNIKMLISGCPRIRGLIWVVSASDGVTEESKTQIQLASQTHIPAVITFLNQSEKIDDAELVDICAMEIREILTDCGYSESKSPIVIGDALKTLKYKGQDLDSTHCKPIVDVIFAMGRCMPEPMDSADLPLLMPIREANDHPDYISTLRGDVIQGHLAVGQALDIVGKGERIKTRLVEMGDGEVIVDAEPGWILPGQVVSEPRSIRSYTAFKAAIYMMTQQESRTHVPLIDNDTPEVHLWTIDVSGNLRLPPDVPILNPGEHTYVSISLSVPMALQIGSRFELKKMGALIAIGSVTKIIE